MADSSLYAFYDFGAYDAPPRLPVPIWYTYATADPKVTPSMVMGWGRLARSEQDFHLLEIDGEEHLFHKNEPARRQTMMWLLEAVKESGVKMRMVI